MPCGLGLIWKIYLSVDSQALGIVDNNQNILDYQGGRAYYL